MDHIGIGFQGDEVRVQQDGPQQHGHLRVAAELFGRGVGQEDRQEVIGRVCDEVEEIVQISALVDPAEEGQHRQQSLDHTGTGASVSRMMLTLLFFSSAGAAGCLTSLPPKSPSFISSSYTAATSLPMMT